MKKRFIGVVVTLALSMVASEAMAQRGQDNRGMQQGGGGPRTQARLRNQRSAGQSQRRNTTTTSQRNQFRQTPTTQLGFGNKPDLLRLREEEKLARDVYASLAKSSG